VIFADAKALLDKDLLDKDLLDECLSDVFSEDGVPDLELVLEAFSSCSHLRV
jgi:hypothetical protein